MRLLRLPLLLLLMGAFVTFVHDYAYRRVGGIDYEFGGLISHAGSDIIVATLAMAVVGLFWEISRRGQR